MTSATQWTWVWVSFRSWWGTGKAGVLQSMGSQRFGHNWVTELNWGRISEAILSELSIHNFFVRKTCHKLGVCISNNFCILLLCGPSYSSFLAHKDSRGTSTDLRTLPLCKPCPLGSLPPCALTSLDWLFLKFPSCTVAEKHFIQWPGHWSSLGTFLFFRDYCPKLSFV